VDFTLLGFILPLSKLYAAANVIANTLTAVRVADSFVFDGRNPVGPLLRLIIVYSTAAPLLRTEIGA